MISDLLWRRRFAADLDVLGRTMALDDATAVIVGVMPPGFVFPDRRESDYWRPLRFEARNGDDDRNNNYLSVIARLKPGITFEQARSEMQVIGDQLQQRFPKELAGLSASAFRWRDEVRADSRLLLWALVGASLCVLLIACTNLANLMMSRALARRGSSPSARRLAQAWIDSSARCSPTACCWPASAACWE